MCKVIQLYIKNIDHPNCSHSFDMLSVNAVPFCLVLVMMKLVHSVYDVEGVRLDMHIYIFQILFHCRFL